MTNKEHVAILKKGVAAWNEWREQHPDIMPDLREAHLGEADLHGAKLSRAYLNLAGLRRANLNEANLGQAELVGVDLSESYLVGADLREANLRGAKLFRAHLIQANLSEADLIGANLSEADLTGAKLSGTDLTTAKLEGANLNQANLYGAHLSGAYLNLAALRGANVNEANLGQANFRGADLTETDFSEARLGWTVFGDVDLSRAKGLETVRHHGPSTIGVDTIYRSQGKIPEVFLRGCGLPDDFIGYVKSIAGAIQFYSCFISYSTKDQDFAERLYNDLQGNGVRCWYAPRDIRGGRKIDEQLDEAIRLHDKLLLILSEHSMNSPWVKTEIANARKREERETKQMLFPITLAPFAEVQRWKLFDADRGIDSAREIREYFIPDFSNWKDHDSYQTAFQRLVKDLKAEAR